MKLLVVVIAIVLYAPLYLPLIISAVLAYRKSWEFASALGIAWLATLITRTIALQDWHSVDAGVAQSFRDAGINLYWMWTPSIVANAIFCTVAAIVIVARRRNPNNELHVTNQGAP